MLAPSSISPNSLPVPSNRARFIAPKARETYPVSTGKNTCTDTPQTDIKLCLFTHDDSTLGIIGDSLSVQAVREIILHLSHSLLEPKVLITGETGTGKELIAKAIHEQCKRSEKPFIAINCAAIAPNLLEAELFGYERGAFTGASKRKLGFFEITEGTIFLDEIGELPRHLQTKLNRVLEDGTFERVGGTKSLKTEARVIAATNRDLERDIEEGRFKEDLFYRLNVIPIHMPPLRERREDIPVLAKHFLEKHKTFIPGKLVSDLSLEAVEKLRKHNWPGNVRELENVIRRAIVFAQNPIMQPDDIAITAQEAESKARNVIDDIALSNASVVIYGETGVGKELAAKRIHELSTRRDKPYIGINCATIKDDLAESQLFGHEKGSFTDADSDHKGFFEIGDGGTLFLDEIGELSFEVQKKLLRVLQESEITPVGASSPKKINVRIISATNRDLEKDVKEGKFREDLFHRLNIIPMKIRPLRERREEIPRLVDEILRKDFVEICPGKTIPTISEEAMQKLIEHDWPGNIRELQNTIIKTAIFVRDDRPIQAEDIKLISYKKLSSNQTSVPYSVYEKYKLELDELIRNKPILGIDAKVLLLKLKIVQMIIASKETFSETLIAEEAGIERATLRRLVRTAGYESTGDLVSKLYKEIFPEKKQ